jgi:hypothetical protein
MGVMKKEKELTAYNDDVYIVQEDTLGAVIYVLYGVPLERYKEILVELANDRSEIPGHIDGEAREVVGLDGEQYFLLWAKNKSLPTLAHEALHIVCGVCASRNISFDESSEELYCYFLDKIIQEVLEIDGLLAARTQRLSHPHITKGMEV